MNEIDGVTRSFLYRWTQLENYVFYVKLEYFLLIFYYLLLACFVSKICFFLNSILFAWKKLLFCSKIHFHFHILLFHTFMLIQYGIMVNLRSEQQEKLFTYFHTKMKKLRISYELRIGLILAPKTWPTSTFIFRAFLHKIWSILIRKYLLVQSMTEIVIKRVNVFILPQKNPHFFLFFLRQSFTKILRPILLLPMPALCGDEMYTAFRCKEWNKRNKF